MHNNLTRVFAVSVRCQVERVSRKQPGRGDLKRRWKGGKKGNYAKAVVVLWNGEESELSSSSLYDSEIINYCFVCRHIAFVTVKELAPIWLGPYLR